ncbi:DegV family protein [Candidatus Chlorohelix sp.]|uniref:DegV family protein n=1 Tax=Candidatus Chlorohelix sp. TaxID=3139201 RepID=UPI003060C1E7
MGQMVKIVTDSTSDMSQEEAAKYGITVVPLTVNMDDAIYRDGIDILPPEFYKRLPNLSKMPTTSQPPVGLFQQTFEKLTADGSQVISLHISGDLSGTFNSASLAAQSFAPGQVTVIDTRWVTAALALPVIKAAELARIGKDAPEIIQVIKDTLPYINLLAVADTLEYLKKGGRIGGLAALAGTILSVKPLFTIRNGKVDRFENVRTKRKALERIAEVVKTQWGPLERLAILHADSPDEAGELASMLASVFPLKDIYISMIGPVVGTYAGPKTLGICAERKAI